MMINVNPSLTTNYTNDDLFLLRSLLLHVVPLWLAFRCDVL